MSDLFYNRIRKQYRDQPDELIAAAAKVEQTLQSPGWEFIMDYLENAEQDALTSLFNAHAGASGKVLEQAEYARLGGYLAGIREPQTVALAFRQAAENASHESP